MIIENKDLKYRSNNHNFFCCNYHVIFCPKYRRSVLNEQISLRLKEIFLDTCKKCNSKLIELEIMPNHIHMILDCDPSFGICKLIRQLKGNSSRILRIEFPELKKKLPCLWTRSSFISSVGAVSLEIVKNAGFSDLTFTKLERDEAIE